ncbi:helix-turn-helix domain-containing protein [Novosphingobium sp.]|uniref:helix-turn-helix domain-containing protein n=1 Tax=Novosphingobium sp. TaxID=1874826 RepID=UPI0035AEE1BD
MITAVEKYATKGVAPAQRLRFWNDLVDRIYSGTFVNTPDGDFQGEMWAWQVGELGMIRPRSTASFVGRKARAGAEERLILHLQCRGTSLHTQNGAESELQPGDFVLGAADDPYSLDLKAHELLVVEFPRQPLAERLPGLDDLLSRRVCGSSPGGRVFHDFLLSLWRQGDQSAHDPEWEDGVNSVFYDLAALAIRGAGNPQERTIDQALRNRVLAMIEARLCDPLLKTTTIAEAFNTSVRTVQNLFAAMGTTPSAYILERRLLRASDRLHGYHDESITEIAFELGFNDSAYFSRCFRQHFGVSPRDWRSGH